MESTEINKDEIIVYLAKELEAARQQLNFYVPLIENGTDLTKLLEEIKSLRLENVQMRLKLAEAGLE
jgi:hypothetical protein